MSKHSVEEVRAMAAEISDYGGTQAGLMLTAYAERIKADEGAVPVYWIYDMGHWYLATKDAYDSWPTEKSKKLYAHPPAQAVPVDREDARAAAFEIAEATLRWVREAMPRAELLAIVDRYLPSAAEPVAQGEAVSRDLLATGVRARNIEITRQQRAGEPNNEDHALRCGIAAALAAQQPGESHE